MNSKIAVLVGALLVTSFACAVEDPFFSFLNKKNKRTLCQAVAKFSGSDLESINLLLDARCQLQGVPNGVAGESLSVRLAHPSNPVIIAIDGRRSDDPELTPEQRDTLEQELVIELLLKIKDSHKKEADSAESESEIKRAQRARRCKKFGWEACIWGVGLICAGILPCVT